LSFYSYSLTEICEGTIAGMRIDEYVLRGGVGRGRGRRMVGRRGGMGRRVVKIVE
jgi:hypothetical protein